MVNLNHVQVDGPLATNLPCELHSHARDLYPLYCEQHHVIPQDWQDEFAPASVVATPFHTSKSTLWDGRTVTICRTGHGNVHYLLVLFMKQRERLGESMKDDLDGIHRIRIMVVEDLRDRQKARINAMDVGVAESAMQRWVNYGLSLMDLCRNGSYGRI